MLSAQAVSVFFGDVPILAELDLEIAAGEVVGLIGPNGAGKTTLLRAMAGLLPLQYGEMRLEGRPLHRMDRRSLARVLAYLPQGGDSHWALTVETLVMLGRLPHRSPWAAPSKADEAAVAQALAVCDVARFGDRPVTQLSGGERTRVLMARALAGEPKVLLADEPVAGLDPGHQLDVMAKLRELAASGAGIVVVMHDLTLAARFCDRLALLFGKQIAAEGCPTKVLSADMLARCYGVRAYHGSVEGGAIVVPLERTDAGADHASA
ncbi:MAG: ABC transporter ATP-binding protein [Rhodospirillaceae bacterium]|nr:ABC transporter ATP-binding protein [Rhodospirillaceae bacterium]MCY4237513.1 ABC transporter ATP-binding protein [Rhodospirillaceae bacterium]MCY4310869.1 ABC transporter ATP-binding protein [Rhodospirillaceae bacterium]